MIMSWNGNLW